MMSNFTRLLFLCLLCVGAFSCIEEIDMTVAPPAEVGDQEIPSTDVTNFKIGANGADLTHAYILTTPAPEGEAFQHHIVLSSEDVLDGDDLRSTSYLPTVALLVETSSTSPVGHFPVTEASFLNAGSSPNFNVSRGNRLLRSLQYDSGSSITITAEGDDFVVTVDLLHNSIPSFTTKGVYAGPILPVVPGSQEGYEPEAIDPEVFTGQNFISHGEEVLDLTNAYLVPDGNSYRLYLSDRPVHTENDLAGTSNVMLLFLSGESNGNLLAGRHRINNDSFQGDGYFAEFQPTNNNIKSSYFCRNMNFDTNRADDDEPMDGGETLVTVNGDTFSIKFSFTSSRNSQVEGEYHGLILNAN